MSLLFELRSIEKFKAQNSLANLMHPSLSTSRVADLCCSPLHIYDFKLSFAPIDCLPSTRLQQSIMLSSRGASSAAIKRLTIEYKQLSSDPNSLFPATGPIDESNYLLWEALVPGPEGTPYEGGVFAARLTFRRYQRALSLERA